MSKSWEPYGKVMKLKYITIIICQLTAQEVQAAPAIYSCQFKEVKTNHRIENIAKIINKNYMHDPISKKAVDQNSDQEVMVLDTVNILVFMENLSPKMLEIMTIDKNTNISSQYSALLTIQFMKKEIRSQVIKGVCVLSQRG